MEVLVCLKMLYHTAVQGRIHLDYHEKIWKEVNEENESRINVISFGLVNLKIIHRLHTNLDSFNLVVAYKNLISGSGGIPYVTTSRLYSS